MFGWLKNLAGMSGAAAHPDVSSVASAEQEAFARLNTLAPITGGGSAAAEAVATPGTTASGVVTGKSAVAGKSFVRREPLLGRGEHVAGYIFNLQEKLQLRLQGKQDLLQRVHDDALLRNLGALGLDSLLGHRRAFVSLSPSSLLNSTIGRLPPENTVLMLTPGQQDLDVAQIVANGAALRERGYALGWRIGKSRLMAHPALLDLAARADYVQIEMTGFESIDVRDLMKHLARLRAPEHGKPQFIGHDLDSYDEFQLCFKLGFDLFSGRFVSSRENWHPPKSDINRLTVIELLNQLRNGEEFPVIANRITHDPVLTFKMLRYINSPAMGLRTPVATMDKALLVLGRENFHRWLSLLLFNLKEPGYRERLLTEQALTRARFLESLAGAGRLPQDKGALFILGLFSMLDLLLGQPLDVILQQIRLSPEVAAALLGEPGVLGDALCLAMAIEGQAEGHDGKNDAGAADLADLAARCGLDAIEVTRQAMAALTWANEIATLDEVAT